MAERFRIFVDATVDGETVVGAGRVEVVHSLRYVNGTLVETRRVSLEVLLAIVPGSGGYPPTLRRQ